MREIKFRAWEKEEKEMCTVNLLEAEVGESEFFRVGIVYDNGNSAWRYSNMVELMQYTGLKDKNGKEIYEGDIVRQKFIEFETGKVTIEPRRGVVVGSSPIWPHDCEIIGNIYENPELLTNTN